MLSSNACSRTRVSLLAAALAAGGVLMGTELLLYSQNSLLRNGAWQSTKRRLEMAVNGADSFLITRTPLSRDRLGLGGWAGFNEVVWRRPFGLGRVEFRARISAAGYLDVVFDKTAAGFSALRLSRDPRRPSRFLRCTPEGRFGSAVAVGAGVPDGGWHRVSLARAAGRVTASLDGRELGSAASEAASEQVFGWRCGARPVFVDDVRIVDARGAVFVESFRNTRHGLRALAVVAAAVLAVFALLSLRRGTALAAVALSLALASCVALFFAFDFFYWSGLEQDAWSRPLHGLSRPSAAQRLEAARAGFFGFWARLAGYEPVTPQALARQGYPQERIWEGPILFGARGAVLRGDDFASRFEELAKRKAAYRLMFIGTSQTVGAGAQSLEDTFAARVHEDLRRALGASSSIETFNMAVSGSTSEQLLEGYRERWLRLRPDLVVIDLSNNDEPERLRRGLRGFLETNESKGIATILLQEANSEESTDARLLPNHRIMAELAREFRVPVYDMHAFLNAAQVRDSGYLWWDGAHLTSYGQDLAARWLTPQLLSAIRSRRLP